MLSTLRFPDFRFGRIFLCSVFFFAFCTAAFASQIGGFVYDDQRNPVVDVDVELLNENYALRGKVRTNGVGRYQFLNLPDGRYYIRVLPFRYNLQDQTQEVILDSFSVIDSGNTSKELDFYLLRKKGGLGDTVTGVVFAEDVPKEAEEMYKDALKELKDEKTKEGMKKLLETVQKYPNYYAAAQRLGMEFLKTKQNENAVQMFILAARVNPKSSMAFYWMGFSLSQLGADYNKAALKALEKARDLAPNSYEVALLEGKLQRKEGDYLGAEKSLLAAKKLAESKIPEIHKELSQLYANDLKQYAKAADELELYLKASNQKDENVKKLIEDLRAKAKNSTE